MTIRGSCLCKAIAYELDLPFERIIYCHCSRCRKATRTIHAANGYTKPEALRWVRGEDLVRRFDLPEARSFATCFCTKCGSPLPHLTRSGRELVVPAGSLDDDPGLLPSLNIFLDSRAAWARPPEELPSAPNR